MTATKALETRIAHGDDRNTLVIALSGELDMMACSTLQNRLLPVMATRPALVVFDLAELTFLGSLGMGVLMEFRRAIRRAGGQVHLQRVLPQIAEALCGAGLAEVFGLSAQAVIA